MVPPSDFISPCAVLIAVTSHAYYFLSLRAHVFMQFFFLFVIRAGRFLGLGLN